MDKLSIQAVRKLILLMTITASLAFPLDYSSLITEEWTYRNVMVQNTIGAVGWLSMFIGFATTYHYYKLVQQDKVAVLSARIAELKGQEPYDEELIEAMEALLEGAEQEPDTASSSDDYER